jgi:O-antigen ligase
MAAPRRLSQIYLPLLGIALAALWPLTAYLLNPLFLPVIAIAAAAVVVGLRWPEYALAAAIALAPLERAQIAQSQTAGLTLPADPLRYLVPLLIVSVLGYGILVRGLDRRPVPSVAVGILMLVGAVLLSGLDALEPGHAVSFLLIVGAILFFAVVNLCRTRQQLLVVLGGVMAALLISSVQGIVQHQIGDFTFIAPTGGTSTAGRVQAAFGQPDDYGGFLALLIPAAVGLTFSRSIPAWLRILSGAAGATGILALAYSYSRWSIVACVAGVLIWLLLTRPKVALISAAAIAFIALALAPGNLQSRFQSTNSADLTQRNDVNKTALDIYSEHPVFGVGVKNFQIAYAERVSAETATQRRLFHNQQLLVPTAAPNEYLNTLAEQGIVGLVALLTFVVLAVKTAWSATKSRDPTVSAIGVAVGMAVTAMIVNSFSSISLQDVPVLMMFGLLAIAGIARDVFATDPG